MIIIIIVNVQFGMLRVGQREKTNSVLISSSEMDMEVLEDTKSYH